MDVDPRTAGIVTCHVLLSEELVKARQLKSVWAPGAMLTSICVVSTTPPSEIPAPPVGSSITSGSAHLFCSVNAPISASQTSNTG